MWPALSSHRICQMSPFLHFWCFYLFHSLLVFSPGRLLVHINSQLHFQTRTTLHKFKQICTFSTSNPQHQPSPSVHTPFVHTHICLPALLIPPSSVASVLLASVGGSEVWSDCFSFPFLSGFLSPCHCTSAPKEDKTSKTLANLSNFVSSSIRHCPLHLFVEHHPRCFKQKTHLFPLSFFYLFFLTHNTSNLLVYCYWLADLSLRHWNFKGQV